MRKSREELKKLNISRKRGRSDGSTPDKPSHNPPKRVTNTRPTGIESTGTESAPPAPNSQPSYKDMAKVVRVAVIPSGFPDTTWCDEELRKIQMAVLDKIVELKKGSIKPQFAGCTFKPGWLIFNCIGEGAAKWIRDNIPTIKPWDGAQLKVVAENEIPRAEIFVGYFPENPETPTQRILSLIEGQNEGLKVELWKVLNRVSKGNMVELTMAIDPKSAAKLKEKNLHIGYGYGTVHIRPTRQQRGSKDDVPKRTKVDEGTKRNLSAAKDSHNPIKCTDKPACSGPPKMQEVLKSPPASSANSSKGTSNSLKESEKPTCSKWIKAHGKKKPVESGRPRKGHGTTAEERILHSSNRGRKMAKRIAKK